MSDPIERLDMLIAAIEAYLAEEPGASGMDLLHRLKDARKMQASMRTSGEYTCVNCGQQGSREYDREIHLLPSGLTGSVGCRANSYDLSRLTNPQEPGWDDTLDRRWKAKPRHDGARTCERRRSSGLDEEGFPHQKLGAEPSIKVGLETVQCAFPPPAPWRHPSNRGLRRKRFVLGSPCLTSYAKQRPGVQAR